MNGQGGGVRLTVRGEQAAIRARVEHFFLRRGWRLRERPDATIGLERGSVRRTILLGALARDQFYVTAACDVRAGDHRTAEVHYRFGPGTGVALGGTLGRRRALALHEQIRSDLEAEFARSGDLVRAARA